MYGVDNGREKDLPSQEAVDAAKKVCLCVLFSLVLLAQGFMCVCLVVAREVL